MNDEITQKIEKALTFDPAKNNPGADCLKEALGEILAERNEELKSQVKETLKLIIEARQKFAKVKSDFLAAEKNFEKTVNKALGKIERIKNNEPAEETETEPTQNNH
jgi:hypothetical protein